MLEGTSASIFLNNFLEVDFLGQNVCACWGAGHCLVVGVSLASVSLVWESGACRDTGVQTRDGTGSGASREAASAPWREPLGQEDPLHPAHEVLTCSVTRASEPSDLALPCLQTRVQRAALACWSHSRNRVPFSPCQMAGQ